MSFKPSKTTNSDNFSQPKGKFIPPSMRNRSDSSQEGKFIPPSMRNQTELSQGKFISPGLQKLREENPPNFQKPRDNNFQRNVPSSFPNPKEEKPKKKEEPEIAYYNSLYPREFNMDGMSGIKKLIGAFKEFRLSVENLNLKDLVSEIQGLITKFESDKCFNKALTDAIPIDIKKSKYYGKFVAIVEKIVQFKIKLSKYEEEYAKCAELRKQIRAPQYIIMAYTGIIIPKTIGYNAYDEEDGYKVYPRNGEVSVDLYSKKIYDKYAKMFDGSAKTIKELGISIPPKFDVIMKLSGIIDPKKEIQKLKPETRAVVDNEEEGEYDDYQEHIQEVKGGFKIRK